MERLEKVTFVLANGESVNINEKYFGTFVLDEISESYERGISSGIIRQKWANLLICEVYKLANAKNEFAQFLSSDIAMIKLETIQQNPFNRTLATTKYYTYYIDWCQECDDSNDFQETLISKEGNLYIVISKNEYLEYYFPKKEINNHKLMEEHFRELGIIK